MLMIPAGRKRDAYHRREEKRDAERMKSLP